MPFLAFFCGGCGGGGEISIWLGTLSAVFCGWPAITFCWLRMSSFEGGHVTEFKFQLPARFLWPISMAEEDDFQVVLPDHVASRLFFDDPIENLQLRVLVKKVPPAMRKLNTESLKRVAMQEKLAKLDAERKKSEGKEDNDGML